MSKLLNQIREDARRTRSTSQAAPAGAGGRSGGDATLIRECLGGREEAWEALIDKYKNLIFSIPIKQGFSQEQATDIFQEVCLELIGELPRLRDPNALPKWLIQVTSHKCFHLKRVEARGAPARTIGAADLSVPEDATLPDGVLQELEREQMLREAVMSLPERCRRLIEMLFFQPSVRPYREIANGLGLATGSIGFIRSRCLEKLRVLLEEMGF